jgi:hypothetical protein
MKFKIALHTPKKDACSSCETYKNMTEEQRIDMQESYDAHLRRKVESRQLKDEHKQRAKEDPQFYTSAFHLEQVRQCPLGQNNLLTISRDVPDRNKSSGFWQFQQSHRISCSGDFPDRFRDFNHYIIYVLIMQKSARKKA